VKTDEYVSNLKIKISSLDNPVVWEKIYMAQNDEEWWRKVTDFNELWGMPDGGCCITSASMAIQFFYPNKNFTPNDFLDANNGRGLFNDESNYKIKKAISYFEGLPYSQASVEVSNKIYNWDAIKEALQNGYPVVAHTKAYGWDSHGGHCVLIVEHLGGQRFMVLDPIPHTEAGYDRFQSYDVAANKLNFGIIFRPREGTGQMGQIDTNQVSEDKKIIENRDFEMELNLISDTVEEVDSVELQVVRNNFNKLQVQKNNNQVEKLMIADQESFPADVEVETYSMKKINNKWKVESPGFKNKEDFAYRVVTETNDGRRRISDWQKVEVENDNSVFSETRGFFSKVKYYLTSSSVYQFILNQIESYNGFLDKVRRSYLESKNKGDIVGIIKDKNRNRLENAKVIIDDKETLVNADGSYKIEGVSEGDKIIKVIDSLSGENFLIKDLSQATFKDKQEITIYSGSIVIKDLLVE
jgi:hypothetical protein